MGKLNLERSVQNRLVYIIQTAITATNITDYDILAQVLFIYGHDVT